MSFASCRSLCETLNSFCSHAEAHGWPIEQLRPLWLDVFRGKERRVQDRLRFLQAQRACIGEPISMHHGRQVPREQLGAQKLNVPEALAELPSLWARLHSVLRGGVLECLDLRGLLHAAVRGYLLNTVSACAPLGRAIIIAWACRIEYPEGAHRPATQRYHGRGVSHVHLCVWLDALYLTALPRWLRADAASDEGELHAAVLRQQRSDQATPPEEPESTWTDDLQGLRLRRDSAGQALGLRPYLTPLVLAGFGHHDLQTVSAGNMATFLAKRAYISKASSLPDAALEPQSSNYQAARGLLRVDGGRSAAWWSHVFLHQHEEPHCAAPG